MSGSDSALVRRSVRLKLRQRCSCRFCSFLATPPSRGGRLSARDTGLGQTLEGFLNSSHTVLVKDLFYSYPPLIPDGAPVEALRGVSLQVKRGEFLAIMGPSGAGKTTLCLALCAIVPHSTGGIFGGKVVVCGKDTRETKPPELSAQVGVVFQDPEGQLFTTVVEDEVAFGPESLGLPRSEIEERVSWALDKVRMSAHRLRNPAYLSGGQKQRVAIATALATRPEVLVLDEPTASLDPVGTDEVVQVLASLRQEIDASIIMVTQNAELASDFADRIVLLKEGRIGHEGTPAKLLQDTSLLKEYAIRPPQLAELSAWLSRNGLHTSFHRLPEALTALRKPLEEPRPCRPS